MRTSNHGKLLIVIVGPTAVGKTYVSVELANRLSCAVINADSRQLFREMTIGTAKPLKEEMKGVKHYFVDDRSVKEEFSAGRFENEVLHVLSEEFKFNDACIMSGGSGLYIDAACYGLDSFPKVDAGIREELNNQLEKEGVDVLYQELLKVDKDYAEAIESKNTQRIIRGLEIYRASGQTYSSLRLGLNTSRDFNILFIGLERPREELYDRINKRVDVMIKEGLFEEAAGLIPYRDKNALQTVGYNEIFLYMDGKIDRQEAVRLLKRNSRRYAKRQMTWFKRNQETTWFHPDDIEGMFSYIKRFLHA
ncbi:MAG: tRNA (adenosine(37)-N6)-dimethylallyltransferase MiaA [Bacteroidota bacterium]